MLKVNKIIICFAIVISVLSVSAFADFDKSISAQSAVLYCCNTGETLYEKNADEQRLIASVTKIMTAIVIIENCDLDESIEIKPEWCAVEGSSMYLDYTKKYTIRQLLTGMMLVSGNDAATALACNLCGDERSFSAKMNSKAAELGMLNSSFRNPHGLDDEEHYSTAKDLAILTDYCMNNEEFKSIVSCYSAEIYNQTYFNHNKLLINYDGCIGVKTGYTIAAGRTLVSCAERNGMRLVCVTLNASDDWNDQKKLFDYGFNNYKLTSFTQSNFRIELPIYSSVKSTAEATVDKDIKLLTEKGKDINVKLEVPKMLFAGGIKGEKVGTIKIYADGILAAQEKLVYTESVPIDTSVYLSVSEKLHRILNEASKPLYIK